MLDRRRFGALALAGLAGSVFKRRKAHAQAVEGGLSVTTLIYDKMVMMDLIGPLTVFNLMRARVDLISHDGGPVTTELGLDVAATAGFEEAVRKTDILFVPGGLGGTVEAIEDPGTRRFVAEVGQQASWVTSVCTGSLLLGAAGLLRGYEATSHWYVRDLLAHAGARVSSDRVVEDRNRLTGGGVTAGLDFALRLAARIRGEEVARSIQLVLEYNPDPPFDSGSPEVAKAELVDSVLQRRSPLIERARSAMLGITQ
jgi:transcriptional regulator GlxA family with amidase domain